MLTIEEIDGMIEEIDEAEKDDNWEVVSSLISKSTVLLLADIDKRLDKLVRVSLAQIEN